MERQEPRLDKDMQDVEFRPRSYRDPSLPLLSSDNQRFAWKLGLVVGIGVLAALLIFNAYERYHVRRDAEQTLQVIKQEAIKFEQEMQVAVRTVAAPAPHLLAAVYPIPSGYRCAKGGIAIPRRS